MNEKEQVIDEFKEAHDEYLHMLQENLSPDERKPLIEESLQNFHKLLAEKDTTEVGEFRKFIQSVRAAQDDVRFVRGTCSKDCLMNLLRAQDFVMTTVMAQDKLRNSPEVWIGMLEASNSIIADSMHAIYVTIADKTKHTWQVRDDVHGLLLAGTKLLIDLCESIKQGHIMTIKLPAVDKEKYKDLLN